MWDVGLGGALTPKFYVALTGTSSLISGLILIFEWWYFRKYGTSFIEQVSLSHLGPWLGVGAGAGAASPPAEGAEGAGGAGGECGVWRNPLALLRGAEYARLWTAARTAPLTYRDMNLTAQEHQAWFGSVGAGPGEEALGRAWREREPTARVRAARLALAHSPHCAAALLLLAEEDAPTVLEAERVLRSAWRCAEASLRGGATGAVRARDAAVLAHVKRRAAACQRRLGRPRLAARAYRELAREGGAGAAAALEALVECLLARRLYGEAGAACARLEDAGARSACAAYTRALLAARGGGAGAAVEEAMRAAFERNPHVPELLLELRALRLPPEHVLRGGASEARAYAFFHLAHWRAAPGALDALSEAWRAWERSGRARRHAHASGACAACVDASLLADGEGGCVASARAGGSRRLGCAALACALVGATAWCAHRWPTLARAAASVLRLDRRGEREPA